MDLVNYASLDLKPLWSPVLEMFKSKKFFVVTSQFVTAITFALIAFALPIPNFFAYTIALLAVIGFSGATNDIATDGVYLSVLSSKDQARYIGWQGASYNVGKFLAYGGFVTIAGILEKQMGVVNAWVAVMIGIAGVMALVGLYHSRMLPGGEASTSEVQSLKEGFATLWDVLKTFFQKNIFTGTSPLLYCTVLLKDLP